MEGVCCLCSAVKTSLLDITKACIKSCYTCISVRLYMHTVPISLSVSACGVCYQHVQVPNRPHTGCTHNLHLLRYHLIVCGISHTHTHTQSYSCEGCTHTDLLSRFSPEGSQPELCKLSRGEEIWRRRDVCVRCKSLNYLWLFFFFYVFIVLTWLSFLCLDHLSWNIPKEAGLDCLPWMNCLWRWCLMNKWMLKLVLKYGPGQLKRL